MAGFFAVIVAAGRSIMVMLVTVVREEGNVR